MIALKRVVRSPQVHHFNPTSGLIVEWCHYYVNDTQLYLSFPTASEGAISDLNQCLMSIMDLMTVNQLTLIQTGFLEGKGSETKWWVMVVAFHFSFLMGGSLNRPCNESHTGFRFWFFFFFWLMVHFLPISSHCSQTLELLCMGGRADCLITAAADGIILIVWYKVTQEHWRHFLYMKYACHKRLYIQKQPHSYFKSPFTQYRGD